MKRVVSKNRVIGESKKRVNLATVVLQTGTIFEFHYGVKQKPGQVGGWKNDPTPHVLLLYDDGQKYVEGINMNYLTDKYLKVLFSGMRKFSGLKDGRRLYVLVKTTAPRATKVAYRKYIRSSVNNVYTYEWGII